MVILNWVDSKIKTILKAHPLITFCKFPSNVPGGSWDILLTTKHKQKDYRPLSLLSGGWLLAKKKKNKDY